MAAKLWTAAEMERLSPAEVDALFAASIVTDLDQVPADFLDRVRARTRAHIARAQPPTAF